MQILLDPFYGVFRPGVILAKWLNRLLLIVELVIFVNVILYLATDFYAWWEYALVIVACFIGVHIVNLVIRGLWNIVMVIIYGTTDPDEIVDSHERRRRH